MSRIQISPALAGFIKGLMLTIVLAVVSFIGDANNLGMLSPAVAALVASIASAIESSMKSKDEGNTALFGAVSVKK